MDTKIFAFDVETTGTNPQLHSIIELAGILIINGKAVDRITFECKPMTGKMISPEALSVQKLTYERMMERQDAITAYSSIYSFFSKYCNKYDKSDKIIPLGYNVRFDLEMLDAFFRGTGNKYGVSSFLSWYYIDVFALFNEYALRNEIKLENHRLETVAKHFGIEFEAHNAEEDIRTTLKIYKLLRKGRTDE